MLRSPVLLLQREVGEVRLKVWRVEAGSAASGVAFKHRRRGGGCNCSTTLTEIARKNAPLALARGKLCIPLQMILCDRGTSETFVMDLRPLADSCPSHRRPTRIPSGTSAICLGSPKSRTNFCIDEISQEDNCKIERVRRSYERIIKDLIKKVSPDNYDSKTKNNIDKRSIIEMCLKNDISSEKIVCLLKELECNEEVESNEGPESNAEPECEDEFEEDNVPNMCDNCIESNPNRQCMPPNFANECKEIPYSYSSYPSLRTKNFKIVPSSTTSCAARVGNDCSGSISPCTSFMSDPNVNRNIPMYKTVRANHCIHDQSGFNYDLKEIKMILNNIVTAIKSSDTCDDKLFKIPTINNHEKVCEENKSLNTDNILNLIFRHVSQCKCDPSDQCNGKEINNSVSPENSYSENFQKKYIPLIEHDNDNLYTCLPNTIPLIKDVNKTSPYQTNDQHFQSPSTYSPTANIESQYNKINNSLHIKETPAALIEYLRTLPPPDSKNGITHIHYYANNDSGSIITSSSGLNANLSPGKDSKEEQQLLQKNFGCKDNITNGYSRIIIDINSLQPRNKKVESNDIVKNEMNKLSLTVLEQPNGVKNMLQDDLETKTSRRS